MTVRYPSTYSSIIAPIETVDSQLEEAEADGWRLDTSAWSDRDDAWHIVLRRPKP